MTLHRRKGTLQAFSRSFRYRCIRTSGFWRRDLDWSELERGEHRISRFLGFSMSWSGGRSHGWIHEVSDVWMNRWVLKKLSKDVFDGLAEYVKNMAKKLQHMYVCVPHVRKSTTHRDRNRLGE